ncbi:MAG TPA: AMP-binding protein, partial [Plasticicumulans sp.]|nr:AMP-binding protein [Plasticicumulans sp.]
MEPIWLAEYPPGVPATIDPDSTGTLPELFAESCARFADRAACRSLGHEISYAELARRAGEFTAWLQGLGVAPGTRVALMMPNVLQYPVALFGTLAAGCTVVGVNPL